MIKTSPIKNSMGVGGGYSTIIPHKATLLYKCIIISRSQLSVKMFALMWPLTTYICSIHINVFEINIGTKIFGTNSTQYQYANYILFYPRKILSLNL